MQKKPGSIHQLQRKSWFFLPQPPAVSSRQPAISGAASPLGPLAVITSVSLAVRVAGGVGWRRDREVFLSY